MWIHFYGSGNKIKFIVTDRKSGKVPHRLLHISINECVTFLNGMEKKTWEPFEIDDKFPN